ncbi:MAG: class I SAM-dependent methyltransferase [Pseudanabaenaceae cyanobacterium bins.68]|nr:class I SAM-dependent methyltransferase [Pseudanabaenaceae cyanobacterium bins.68]
MANTPIQHLIDHLVQAQAATTTEALGEHLATALTLALGLNSYAQQYSTPASAQLEAIATITANLPWENWFKTRQLQHPLKPQLSSSPFQGQLLKFLVKLNQASRVLELGSFTGYSTLAIAEALPDHGEVIAYDRDPQVIAIAQKLLGNCSDLPKIDLRLGEIQPALEQLAATGEQFDFIFLDANKKAYLSYYEQILGGNLLKRSGILCVDNTLFKGDVFLSQSRSKTGQAIAEFNRQVASDRRVEQIILPIEDGVSLIRLV